MNIFSQRLIAETACGHNGNIKILKKLINIAKNCGAKVINLDLIDKNKKTKKIKFEKFKFPRKSTH